MKIYNLTGSNLTFNIGSAKMQVKNLTSSSSIVATPELVRNNILPLIETFNGGILLVPNTSDMLIFDMPGCKVPADCVVDDKIANQRLNKALAEFRKKNAAKPENKKPENKKPELKVDEAKKPEITKENIVTEVKDQGIQITKIKGKESQEVKTK